MSSDGEFFINPPKYNMNENVNDIFPNKIENSLRKVRENKHERKRDKKIVNDKKEKDLSSLWKSTYMIQLLASVVAAVVAAISLYLINPPLTQKKRTDPYTSEKQDWRKVLFVVFLVFIFAFLIPIIVRLFMKIKGSPPKSKV